MGLAEHQILERNLVDLMRNLEDHQSLERKLVDCYNLEVDHSFLDRRIIAHYCQKQHDVQDGDLQ